MFIDTSAKIWDEENKVFSDQNVVYCSSNNLGMYMAVETNQEKNAAMVSSYDSFVDFVRDCT